MSNVSLNSASEAILYEKKIIAEVEQNSFFMPMVGKTSDMNSFIYRPADMYKSANTCRVPLRAAITDSALEDGATYEGNEVGAVISTTDITLNERGLPFGGQSTFEEMKTVLDLREQHYEEAKSWATADFDKAAFESVLLATGSMPLKSARSTSQYNVDFEGDASGWDSLNTAHYVTSKGISRAKKYFQKRGIRPAQLGGGKTGYILVVPTEVTYQLAQEDLRFQDALANALPRSNDHIFFSGHGLNPWGAWDGVVIVEDLRPVYGGTDGTFLNTETEDEGGFIRAQCLFMGAQGIAYTEWQKLTWFERIYDYGRKFGVSVTRSFGFAKTVLNRGTLLSTSNRDYGTAFYNCAAPII